MSLFVKIYNQCEVLVIREPAFCGSPPSSLLCANQNKNQKYLSVCELVLCTRYPAHVQDNRVVDRAPQRQPKASILFLLQRRMAFPSTKCLGNKKSAFFSSVVAHTIGKELQSQFLFPDSEMAGILAVVFCLATATGTKAAVMGGVAQTPNVSPHFMIYSSFSLPLLYQREFEVQIHPAGTPEPKGYGEGVISIYCLLHNSLLQETHYCCWRFFPLLPLT